jgi:hypothetical protein
MSPLLRSLTYTQAALGPVIGSMLLQCYCALDFELAHAALMHLNETERRGRGWTVCDTDYVEICAVLAVYSEQLSRASLIDIAKAEAAMLEGLLRSSKTSEQVLEAA